VPRQHAVCRITFTLLVIFYSIGIGIGMLIIFAMFLFCRWMKNETLLLCYRQEVEHHQVRDVLRCILHTILFNRALGLVRPRDVDLELFNITYVQCVDITVEREVNARVEAAMNWLDKNPRKPVQVSLSFFEKRYKQAWFSKQEERLYWEQWTVCIHCSNHRQRSTTITGDTHDLQEHHERQKRLQDLLRETLAMVLRHVNEKREHIPPVVSSEAVTFPYEIAVSR